MTKRTTEITVEDFTNDAMRAYGSFVIEERAVADFRDGLKPVQRRIMFAAQHDVKLKAGGRSAKSAKLVGDTMGNYHPHGNAAVYGAIVNMVQMRYPILEGQGNFGTILGDPPAADRYTEIKLNKLSEKFFECLDVGEFTENYSGDRKEPIVLPSRAPFLLMNGSEGIAVGLSANIPPHNLGELLKALHYVLDKGSKACCKAIAKLMPGPDYPFGGVILSDPEEIESMYQTGKGSLKFRCGYHYETDKGIRKLVITSFAPRFKLSSFLEKCQDMVEKGLLEAVYDESSEANGWRIVVEYKNAVPIKDYVLPMLHTSVTYIFYVTERDASGNVETTQKNMKALLLDWLDYRIEIETLMLERERNELKSAAEKHEARLAAVNNWNELAKILGSQSATEDELLQTIATRLKINNNQAKHILKTELGVLRKANKASLVEETKKTHTALKEVEAKLKNVAEVVKAQLKQLDAFVDERKTLIREEAPSLKGTSGSRMWAHIIADKGFVDYSPEIIKRKARPYSFLVDATEGFTLISKGGTVKHYTPFDDAQGDSTLRDIIGVAPIGKRSPYVFVANAEARGAALVNPHKTQSEYTAFKTDAPLVFACGYGRGDRIWVRDSEKTAVYELGPKEIKKSQRGGVGKKTFKGRKKNIEYLHVPARCSVLDEYGYCIGPDEWLSKERAFVVGPQDNYVVYENRSKAILDYDDIAEELRNGANITWISPI